MALKGLVLAGGRGTRLRPLSYSGPKQLVPVANRPILDYALASVREAGVEDIGIIVSPEHRAPIEAHLRDLGPALGARATVIEQERPGGLAHAVLTAKPFLGTAPFLLVLGDNLVGASLREAAARFTSEPACAARIWLKEAGDPTAFGVARVDPQGRVLELVEKPRDPPSNLALVGVYLLRASIFPIIEALTPSARGELEITDALSALIARGDRVDVELLESFWLDTGKKDDLLSANRVVLSHRLTAEQRGHVDPGSTVLGVVEIGLGAVVTRSRISGPTVIGPGCIVSDSVVGPGSAVGAGCTIERAEVEESVILPNTVVRGARLMRSLVGQRCHIELVDAGTLQLSLGDDCEVRVEPGARGATRARSG